MIELQNMVDHIMAFWGTADDLIASERIRDILKTGKRVERIDLYGRLSFSLEDLKREVHRMTFRVKKSGMKYDEEKLKELEEMVESGPVDYRKVVELIEAIIVV